MSPDTAVSQATRTVGFYLDDTIRILDTTFGEGYAAANPALMGVMIQAASNDYEVAMKAGQIE